MLEVRTRGEYRRSPTDLGGAGTAVVDDAWTVMERSRLGLGAERGPLRAQVTLQDARAWGASSPLSFQGQASPFAVFGAYEAFVEIHAKPEAGTDAAEGRPRRTFFRLGRQALAWDDGRVLGRSDWSPSGRSLDAARLHGAFGILDLEAFGAILDAARPFGASFDNVSGPYSSGSELFGALASVTVDPLFKVQLEGLARLQGAPPPLVESSDFALARSLGETYTGVLRISGDGKPLEYALAGYVQGGHASQLSGDRATRLAYAFHGDVARKLDGIVLTPKVRIGAAYASGDDGTGNYRAFDPILPDPNTHYGAMSSLAFSNLFEAHGALSLFPSEETRVDLEYRYARLVNATGEWLDGYLFSVGRTGGPSNAYELGHELDLAFRWRPLPELDIAAGYAGMLLGDGAKAILSSPAVARGERQSDGSFKPADFSHFGYLSVTARVP